MSLPSSNNAGLSSRLIGGHIRRYFIQLYDEAKEFHLKLLDSIFIFVLGTRTTNCNRDYCVIDFEDKVKNTL